MTESALQMLLPKVFGLRCPSKILIYSFGDGTDSTSFLMIVPENLFDFFPLRTAS